jgi:hypothetical protein
MADLFPLVLIAAAWMQADARPVHPQDMPYRPGEVSTEAAEVRINFSPDGGWAAWGTIGREADADQQDIWLSQRVPEGWSAPFPASFNTASVEFDPAFSPDGRTLYFHSDRPGGQGGTDLYAVGFDPATRGFSAPVNLGSRINSEGDEWAPLPTPWGTLIFASDGWGGEGAMDLVEADLTGAGEAGPRNLGPQVNTPQLDFDATLTLDGSSLIFSSGTMSEEEATVRLFRSARDGDGGWTPRTPIGVGCSSFVIGPSFDPADPDHFYYAANCEGGFGRMDIRRVSSEALRDAAGEGAGSRAGD